jgi:hypothetical protein
MFLNREQGEHRQMRRSEDFLYRGAGYKVHSRRTAMTGHRGLQNATLKEEIPCMLLCICNPMDFVV